MNILSILIAIFSFGILIMIHELGHLIAAKKNDIKVTAFAVGMGPAIFKKQVGETEYSLRIIPLGGYCMMEGEEEASDDRRSFSKKAPWRRLIVISMGAIVNIVAGILLFTIISLNTGIQTLTIDTVSEGSAAEAAALQKGDTILSVEDRNYVLFESFATEVSNYAGETVTFTVLRDGEPLDVEITLGEEAPILGTTFQVAGINPLSALQNGVQKGFWMVKTTFVEIGKMITGQAEVQLTGPVGITAYVSETITQSSSVRIAVLNILSMMGMISLSIGLFNLLPLPALDGGKIVFILIEMIRRKPVPVEKENIVHLIGFVLLILLSIIVLYQDIVRIFFS